MPPDPTAASFHLCALTQFSRYVGLDHGGGRWGEYTACPRAAPEVPGPARLAGPDARTSTHGGGAGAAGRGAAFRELPSGSGVHEEKQISDTLGTKHFPKLL